MISSEADASIYRIVSRAAQLDSQLATNDAMTYLFGNLESLLASNTEGIVAGTGVQHTLLDRRAGRAGVHEDDRIRVGVVVEGVPGRGWGDKTLDRVCIDASFRSGQFQSLGWDVNDLYGKLAQIKPVVVLHAQNVPVAPNHPAVNP